MLKRTSILVLLGLILGTTSTTTYANSNQKIDNSNSNQGYLVLEDSPEHQRAILDGKEVKALGTYSIGPRSSRTI